MQSTFLKTYSSCLYRQGILLCKDIFEIIKSSKITLESLVLLGKIKTIYCLNFTNNTTDSRTISANSAIKTEISKDTYSLKFVK